MKMRYAVYGLAGAALGAFGFFAAVGIGAVVQALRTPEER